MKRKRSDSIDNEVFETKKSKTEGNSIKVLICGSVKGHLDYFYTLISNVQKIHGSFLCVFCLGTFIEESNMKDCDKEYIFGNKRAPVTTYVVDSGKSSKMFSSFPLGGEVKNNIFFLGRGCSLREMNGLVVASLNGRFDSELLDPESKDVEKFGDVDIERVLKSNNDQKIDLLLSTQLPDLVLRGLIPRDLPRLKFFEGGKVKMKEGEDEKEVEVESHFSPHVRLISEKIRPRYHFCSIHPSQYFERIPYEHGGIITRIIHLQEIPDQPPETSDGSQNENHNEPPLSSPPFEFPTKFKYFCYGLNIIPFQFCTVSHLATVTPKYFTPSPFINLSSQHPPSNIHHNNTMVPPPQSNHPRFQQQQQRQQQQMMFQPNQQCWFCLSNPNVDKSLILHIGQLCYIALSKGPIIGFEEDKDGVVSNEYHILIIPIRHVGHYHELKRDGKDEIDKYITALKQFFLKSDEDMNFVIYERTIRTKRTHMFVNFIAFSKKKRNERGSVEIIKKEFEIEAKENGITEIQMFEGGEDSMKKDFIMSTIRKHCNYIYFEFMDSSKILCVVRNRIDMNLIRKVFQRVLRIKKDGRKEEEKLKEIVSKKIEGFKGFQV